MDTFDTVCHVKYRIGGRYLSYCHVMDGQKYVCMDELMDDIRNQNCLVYSFGVGKDWSFENTLGDWGCNVYAYDPTIDQPVNISKNVIFKKIGVEPYNSNNKNYESFDRILKTNGHESAKISYVKLDIEGLELSLLSIWLESGLLNKVQQIAFEVHLDPPEKKVTLEFLQTFKDLQLQGNYRIFNWEANNCWKNSNGKKYDYFGLAEIVLKKIDPYTSCAN